MFEPSVADSSALERKNTQLIQISQTCQAFIAHLRRRKIKRPELLRVSYVDYARITGVGTCKVNQLNSGQIFQVCQCFVDFSIHLVDGNHVVEHVIAR